MQRAEVETQLATDIAELHQDPDPEVVAVELKPKKADTTVTRVALLWLPA